MIEYLKLRTLVIGNSGSGKSSLAEGLGALIHAPVSDLDFIIGKTMGSEPSKTKICLGRRLPTSPRHSVGSSKACTGGSPKSQFQEQRPLCGWMSLGMSTGRGCSHVAGVAAGPRPILQSSSDGQKLTGIARRRNP